MTCSVRQHGSDCLSAMIDKAVGMTQLTVSGNHDHPYLSGLKVHRTIGDPEFPIPEPVTFAAFVVEKPLYRLIDRLA